MACIRKQGYINFVSRFPFIISSFFEKSGGFVKNYVRRIQRELTGFIKDTKPKDKKKLVDLISEFNWIVEMYYNAYVDSFMEIFDSLSERDQRHIEKKYNDEFRIRYNEFAAKYEDFLKRVSRELVTDVAMPIPRAKELRAK
jgi:hypothetical protein